MNPLNPYEYLATLKAQSQKATGPRRDVAQARYDEAVFMYSMCTGASLERVEKRVDKTAERWRATTGAPGSTT